MRSQGWADLYDWRLDRAAGTPPLFRQIYVEVRAAILSGALAPGTKLPSSRAMATKLGVARASAVAAYEQLLTEGYVVARAGSGTFVSTDLSEFLSAPKRKSRTPPKYISPAQPALEFERAQAHSEGLPFNTGRTLIDARTAEVWRKLTHLAVRSLGAKDLGYSDPCGLI
jgi:GntR family transcriptional regulator/MocR family aminotransferase